MGQRELRIGGQRCLLPQEVRIGGLVDGMKHGTQPVRPFRVSGTGVVEQAFGMCHEQGRQSGLPSPAGLTSRHLIVTGGTANSICHWYTTR